MAKKKHKPGKIPKQVGGIKIPKELRKTGDALIATARSAAGRELLMAGAAAMVSSIAARTRATSDQPITPHVPPAQPSADDRRPSVDPAEAGAEIARRFIDIIGQAISTKQPPSSGT